MGRRKVDNRVRILIENGVAKGYRTLFVLVGDKSRDQVVYLHHMLSKTSLKQASVLWCYKKELTFSSHRKKRMKQLKAKASAGQSEFNEEDPFEMFVSMTEIRYTYYKDTHKILGNTFKMCVIQDFESMTPNLLCRTVETVEGGGVICILLQSMNSLKQLFALNMDVHARFRTEAHQVVVPRFNERFLLSLSSCPACMVLDDQLRLLPVSSSMRDLQPVPPAVIQESDELKDLKASIKDTPPIGILIGLCKTLDQARVVLEFIMSITEKTLNATLTLTAARGRGKSAAMGIALASAISFGYSNIFVTSPSPENLNTFFEFVIKALVVLGYEEHSHYQVIRSNDAAQNKAVLKIVITRDHRQVIQYISPRESDCLGQAELLIIDEAAAIPLPLVQNLLGPYLVFMASTVSGYEGTGRSLSLKLIQKLRDEATINKTSTTIQDKNANESSNAKNKKDKNSNEPSNANNKNHRKLVELSLTESIRYKTGDFVEKWLNNLLCLDAAPPSIGDTVDEPESCKLYYVNRDTLFGYHKVSEEFLSNCMGLLVSSHYRNSPDDLQTLSDAPSHHLFVLATSQMKPGAKFPTVVCVLQVSFEGKLAKSHLETGSKNPGDMIPWRVGNLFLDSQFPKLSGLRVVRIATHPDLQGRGYGSKALAHLEEYYSSADAIRLHQADLQPQYNAGVKLVAEEEVSLLEETLLPRPPLLPLLSSLKDRPAEYVDYLGVAFGAASSLVTFWKRAGFQCIYVSQVANHLTGENTAIMLKNLQQNSTSEPWLENFYIDFRKRSLRLFSGSLRKLECKMALSMLVSKLFKRKAEIPSFREFKFYWSEKDQLRLENYTRNQVDIHFIADALPKIGHLFFANKIPNCKLKALHMAILCGVGLQRKDYGDIASEFNLTKSVILEQTNILLKDVCSALKKAWEESKTREEVTSNGVSGVHLDNKGVEKMDIGVDEFVTEVRRDMEKKMDEGDVKDKVSDLVESAMQFGIKGRETELKEEEKGRRKKKKLKLASKEETAIKS